MKTGTIVFVSTKSWMGRIIQWFQKRADKESGKYNHTGIYLKDVSGDYIVEATQSRGNKVRAAVCITPLSSYSGKKYTLLFKEPTFDYNENYARALIFSWVGVPYDYKNLIVHQMIQYLFGWWLGRKRKKAHKKVVSHEFTMAFWNDMKPVHLLNPVLFPDWHKARVRDIYHNKHFKDVRV